jgi:hypothetical protein
MRVEDSEEMTDINIKGALFGIVAALAENRDRYGTKLQGAIRNSSISLESISCSKRLGVQTGRCRYGHGSAIRDQCKNCSYKNRARCSLMSSAALFFGARLWTRP